MQEGHKALLLSCSCAGEAREVGRAWAQLASLLHANIAAASGDSQEIAAASGDSQEIAAASGDSQEIAAASGDSQESTISQLADILGTLHCRLRPEAVLEQVHSWASGGKTSRKLVLVGGGETTVTGTSTLSLAKHFSYFRIFMRSISGSVFVICCFGSVRSACLKYR